MNSPAVFRGVFALRSPSHWHTRFPRAVAATAGLLLALVAAPAPAQEVAPSRWQVAWHQRVPFLTAQPQVVDGVVRVFAGNDVYAFDLSTGESLWAVRPPAPQGRALLLGCCQTGAVPTESGLYTLSGGDEVRALDPANGTVRWRRRIGEAVLAPPVAASGTVGVLTLEDEDTVLYGLDSTSGATLWQVRPGRALPLVAGSRDTFFVSLASGATVAIGAVDGRQLWASSIEDRPTLISAAQTYGNLLVLPTSDGLVVLERGTGIQRWAAQLPALPLDPRIVDGAVYARTVEGTVVALDATDGSERWRLDVGVQRTRELSGPVVDRLFAAGMDGVIAIDSSSGNQLWTWSSDAVSVAPVAIDDVVFVVSYSGNVFVLDAATGLERARVALGGVPLVAPTASPDATLLVATDGRAGSDLFAVRRTDAP
jgi:outer membrane protein assembly factor BamB